MWRTNAIIMALTPKECSLLFNGSMSMLVRKSMPKKLSFPFKVYVYQKKHKVSKAIINEVLNSVYGGGKVIGEFVCDKVEECIPDYSPFTKEFFYNDWEDCTATCMTSAEETVYGKGKPLYGWHITKVKLYDKPKDIKEFRKPCPYGDLPCTICPKCRKDKSGYIQCFNTVNRAPQSWCYVEEI